MHGTRIIALLCFAALLRSTPLAAEPQLAGGYVFSDELGGFRLLSASGTGTPADPIVLVEEIAEPAGAMLVVRPLPESDGYAAPLAGRGFLHLAVTKVVINRGRWPWAGFDLELRETPGEPSRYTDGLSFDQLGHFDRPLWSDRFATRYGRHEPNDSVRYDGGRVQPDNSVRLAFNITDVSPRPVFYLVQRPLLLIAGLPRTPRRQAASPRGLLAASPPAGLRPPSALRSSGR